LQRVETIFLNQIKDKNYDCFVYALGPDDRVIPNAPAYDFFYDKLVTQCKKICSAVKKAKIKRWIFLILIGIVLTICFIKDIIKIIKHK